MRICLAMFSSLWLCDVNIASEKKMASFELYRISSESSPGEGENDSNNTAHRHFVEDELSRMNELVKYTKLEFCCV